MRIVLDLQGAQSESRIRGIGRYSLALGLAIARNAAGHEVLLALNGRLLETIEPIRAAFDDLLPQSHIRVWQAPGPVADNLPGTTQAREVAERLREAFLSSLEPDIVHVSSLFEGFGDEAITSIGVLAPHLATAVTLYDLIPLAIPHPEPAYRAHYERKLQSLRRASLWLGISQYSCDEAIRALDLPSNRVRNISCAADPQFAPRPIFAFGRDVLMRAHGISRPFVCAVGAPEDRKNLDALFRAFGSLEPSLRARHQLVLVGHVQEADRQALLSRAAACGLQSTEVVITGHVTDRDLILLYNICEAFVFPSLHEGFGLPALEAMQCGAPVIASNTSSLPEVVGLDAALFDPRSVEAQTLALTRVLTDVAFRTRLTEHGLAQSRQFSWDLTARRALEAMERCHASHVVQGQPVPRRTVIHAVAELLAKAPTEDLMVATAAAIARNTATPQAPQLFVDISELVGQDVGTGVQRVTRSVLNELLRSAPTGYQVEPVYATPDEEYRYARRYIAERFGIESARASGDLPIEYAHGDVFLGLDLQHGVVIQHERFYDELRSSGVRVYFLVYDLLPIRLPHYFMPGMSALHEQWLTVVTKADGAICISRDVADQCLQWVEDRCVPRARPLLIAWCHCGSDIASSLPTRGMPAEADAVLQRLASCPSFLMVGTIEPRKGHLQTIQAFDQLWDAGADINLVIVGRYGWMVEQVMQRLNEHQARNTRLFWLEVVSDEYLERIYAACSCLIAASEGEGYGLPLVEAARHHMPILARDLPVFREVAGVHAHYFTGMAPESLAAAVREWLDLRVANRHPQPRGIASPTWEESVECLKRILTGKTWYASWPPTTVTPDARVYAFGQPGALSA